MNGRKRLWIEALLGDAGDFDDDSSDDFEF